MFDERYIEAQEAFLTAQTESSITHIRKAVPARRKACAGEVYVCACGEQIPPRRWEMGYNTCVECAAKHE